MILGEMFRPYLKSSLHGGTWKTSQNSLFRTLKTNSLKHAGSKKEKNKKKKSFGPTLIVKSLVAVNAIVLIRVGIGERNACLYDANLFMFCFCLESLPIPFCSNIKQAYLKLKFIHSYSEVPNKWADQNKIVWRKKMPPCLLIY